MGISLDQWAKVLYRLFCFFVCQAERYRNILKLSCGQALYTLVKKSPVKRNFFETFEFSGQNMSYSSCQF